jgi:hypothetical protein
MFINSYKSLLNNFNSDFRNRNIYFINRLLFRQLVYSFSEQIYKLWNKLVYRKDLLNNLKQNKKQKRKQKSLESFYRKTKIEIDKKNRKNRFNRTILFNN